MSMQEIDKYFDRATFVHDVEEFMKRWRMNYTSLSILSGVDRNALMRALSSRKFKAKGKTYQGQLTLYIVCRLAHFIDLDVNKYIVAFDPTEGVSFS